MCFLGELMILQKIIKNSIVEAKGLLYKNPFDWTNNDVECMVRFYNILKKNISPLISFLEGNINSLSKTDILFYKNKLFDHKRYQRNEIAYFRLGKTEE